MRKTKAFTFVYKFVYIFVFFAFTATSFYLPSVLAQEFILPAPGTMVRLSPAFNPPLLKGIRVHPDNPLRFDFMIDTGDKNINGREFKAEANTLIKYFLAALTVPEDEFWVNLSPYERDRIVPDALGVTEMGRDLLAQDYILKQLTASLVYPQDKLGSEFWKRVHDKAQKLYGRTDVTISTFNKVWIVPDKAVVYEQNGSAFVGMRHLKVMLEEDYLASRKNIPSKDGHKIGSEVVKEVLIPELEKEVNQGTHFANLRQIFNSMILAVWYKKNLKESILGQVYMDQNKTKGIDDVDQNTKQRIYKEYIEAFKKGVYNFIKEEYDPLHKIHTPRKYFSGGVEAGVVRVQSLETHPLNTVTLDAAMKIVGPESRNGSIVSVTADLVGDADKAGLARPLENKLPGAMRRSGKGMDPEQAAVVDASIAEFFDLPERELRRHFFVAGNREYQELDPDSILQKAGVKIFVLEGLSERIRILARKRGLAKAPVDLFTHPGTNKGRDPDGNLYIDREVYEHTLKPKAATEKGREWLVQWAKHEIEHLQNPHLSEQDVQERVPLPKLLEDDYLAPRSQQEAAFDQISDQTVIDPQHEFTRTYPMAREIFDNILNAAGLDHQQYELHLLKDETPNAFIIPFTNRVYVNIGLLRMMANMPKEAQQSLLASVLAHEITHILQYRKRVVEGEKPELLNFKLADFLKKHIEQYTNEYHADALALVWVDKAGYSVKYAYWDLEELKKKYGDKVDESTPWSTHPKLTQRILEIKRVMRKNGWRSWTAAKSFPEEVVKELPKDSPHVRFINKVEEFSSRPVADRFRHMDDLTSMISDAPDYEALMFVMQHVYYYAYHDFKSDSPMMRASNPEDRADDLETRNNFSISELKQFTEKSIELFLERGKELGKEDKYRILEAQVVRALAADLGDYLPEIRIRSQIAFWDVNLWLQKAPLQERLDFISFGYPFAQLSQSKAIPDGRDRLTSRLFARSLDYHYEHKANMADIKEKVIQSVVKDIQRTGDERIVQEALKRLRQLNYKHPKHYHLSRDWLKLLEKNIIEAYVNSLSDQQLQDRERLHGILNLYEFLSVDDFDLRLKDEEVKVVFEKFWAVLSKDPKQWEDLLYYINGNKELRVASSFRSLSHDKAREIWKRKAKGRYSIPFLFEDIDRNMRLLIAEYNLEARVYRGRYEQSLWKFFIYDLQNLADAMGIIDPKKRIELYFEGQALFNSETVILYAPTNEYLHSYEEDKVVEALVFDLLKNMPEQERRAFLDTKLTEISVDLNMKDLLKLPENLKILIVFSYYTGPIPLEIFLDEEGRFNLNNYFATGKARFGDMRLITKKGIVVDHFSREDLDVFVDFLKASSKHMHDKFNIPLNADTSLDEEKVAAVEEDSDKLDSLTADKRTIVSTWPEYLQIVSSYAESRRAGNQFPSIANSLHQERERFSLFWGESLDEEAVNGLIKEMKAQFLNPDSEETLFRYSRHAHGKILQDRLKKIYDQVPAQRSADILSWFSAIEDSPEVYAQWREKINATYGKTVFRNYFLYAAFVYKRLKSLADFDMTRAFDLPYLQNFMTGLDPAVQQDIRKDLLVLQEDLTHDWRVEVLNLGIIAFQMSTLKGSKASSRRNAVLRELSQSKEVLHLTPGGPDSQVDLLTALIDEKQLSKELRRGDKSFVDKMALLLTSMPRRRNGELDRFLQMILDTTTLSLGERQSLLDIKLMKELLIADQDVQRALSQNFEIDPKDENQSFFYSPLFRDKIAFETLDMEFAEMSEAFKTLKGELGRIKVYFPSFSPMRDGILKSLIERRVEMPEQLALVEPLLMENQDNIDREEVRRRLWGRDVVRWFMSNTSLESRQMFLEWMLGWRQTKSPEMVEFEYRYLLNLDPLREQLLDIKDGEFYSGVRSYVIRQFLGEAIESLLDNEHVTAEFTERMIDKVFPSEINKRRRLMYQGVMDGVLRSNNRDRVKEILIAMTMEWIDIQLSSEKLSSDEIDARFINVFFEANGFMGTRAKQKLSKTTAIDLPQVIREKFESSKWSEKPFEKAVAIRMLDKVVPGGFRSRYKRLIGEPIGSASLKVVYLAERNDGKIVVLKFKRPEVVIDLEDDLSFLTQLLEYVQPYLKQAGVNIPNDFVDSIKKETLKDLDFDQERTDAKELGRIFALRSMNGYNLTVPAVDAVYENMVVEEDYMAGTLLAKEEELRRRGYSIDPIKRRVKKELLLELAEGTYHKNPHGGNIILREDGDLGFIDNSLGRIAPELRKSLFTFLMHIYPKRISQAAVKLLKWDLKEAIRAFHHGQPLTEEELVKIAGQIEREVIRSSEENVAKRFINALSILEQNGVVLHEDIHSLKNYFPDADFFLGDISLRDLPTLYRALDIINKGSKDSALIAPSRPSEKEALEKGGIDLNAKRMDLTVENPRQAIKFQMDPAMLKKFQGVRGFMPIIINVSPVSDLRSLFYVDGKKDGLPLN